MKKIVIMIILSSVIQAQKCSDRSDCPDFSICQQSECWHKPLFPIENIEVWGSWIIIIISSVSNAVGMSGGILSIMILQNLMSFDTYYAIPLSQMIGFGGSLMSVVLKIPLRHPTKDKPLIDYDLLTYVLAPILGGTTIGVIFYIILPNWLTLLLLCILQAYISYTTTIKGINLYQKESNFKDFSNKNDETRDESSNSIDYIDPEDIVKVIENDYTLEESKMLPIDRVWKMVWIIFVVIIGRFMLGGKVIDSLAGIEMCSESYWISFVLYVLMILLITIYNGKFLIENTRKKQWGNYDFDEGDVKWNLITTWKVGLYAFMTGILAGSLGVGGGLIMTSFLINLGVRPEVSSASSSFVILFSSLISVVQYLITGLVDFSYGLWLFCLALLGSWVGFWGFKRKISHLDRPSLIILVLALMTGVNAICLSLTWAFETYKAGSLTLDFSSFC